MSKSKEEMKKKFPWLILPTEKIRLTEIRMRIDHAECMANNIEVDLEVKNWGEDSVQDSIIANVALRLKTDLGSLFGVVEPAIRKGLELADTTSIKITFIKVCSRIMKKDIWDISVYCKFSCQATGLNSKDHTLYIGHSSEIAKEINKITEKIGITLKTDGVEEVEKAVEEAAENNRFQMMDIEGNKHDEKKGDRS